MRILWVSNASWASTGYGNQTKLAVPRIKGLGHEIAVFAFWGLEGGVLHMSTEHGPVPVYPRAYHGYGQDVMAAHARNFGADIIISLMDAWVMRPENVTNGLKLVPWFPVDMEPLPPPVERVVRQTYKRIVFSKFGERMVHDAGMDCYYVPHAVDTKTFHPIDKMEAREKVGLPKDAYIVGMVAANKGNPSRKAFTQQIQAFAAFKSRHTDAVLYLHSQPAEHGENEGVNLPEYCRYIGLRPGIDVIFPDPYQLILGFGDDWMNALYNSFDVKMLVSSGEGFGIPILEAQAAGCPVIVGDWTSMSELCFSGRMVDRKDAEAWWTPLAAHQFYAHPRAIEICLEAERKHPSSRERAREGALAYDADLVAGQYWKPVLAEIEQTVSMWKEAEQAREEVPAEEGAQ